MERKEGHSILSIFQVFDAKASENIERLYNKYYKLLCSVISKNIHNQEDIEDCVQESFLYFMKNYKKFYLSSEKETKNFLATIANGFSINKYKENIKRENNNCDAIEDLDTLLFDKGVKEASLSELKIIIDQLSEKDKNFFYLTYIYGLKSEEIAKMFQIKPSYVRKRLQICREYLRKELLKNQ